MGKKNLIKEAIADAKAVREMAVKQAKAALEEAFAPQVDAIISKRLREEDDEFEDENAPEIEDEMEEAISPESGVELGTDDEHDEAEENSGLTEEADTSDIGTGDNKEPSTASSEETTEDPGGTQDVDPDHDTASESDLTEDIEEDVDLEEIIRELEEEGEEGDFEEDKVGEDDEGTDLDFGDEGEESSEEDEGEKSSEEDELEIEIVEDENEEEFTEPEGEYEPEVPGEVEPDGDEEEELDLEALISMAEEDEYGDDEKEMGAEEDEMEMENLRRENRALKARLGEALTANNKYKKSLNEINILNAKLLFTNKVFSEYNLDDSSKIKVIENFDRAKTIREVKLIFATLMENMKADRRGKSSKVQRLTEGASKALGSTKTKKSTEQIVNEQDDVRSRVHKLINFNK